MVPLQVLELKGLWMRKCVCTFLVLPVWMRRLGQETMLMCSTPIGQLALSFEANVAELSTHLLPKNGSFWLIDRGTTFPYISDHRTPQGLELRSVTETLVLTSFQTSVSLAKSSCKAIDFSFIGNLINNFSPIYEWCFYTFVVCGSLFGYFCPDKVM